MQFKDNWEDTKRRFDAFWLREDTDRCCLAVTAPKKGASYPAWDNPPLETQWLDADYRINKFLKNSKATYFAGEAFPAFCINLGPGVVASFVGGSYFLDRNTVWFDKDSLVKDITNHPPLKLDTSSEFWKLMMKMNSKLHNKNILSAVTDLGGSLDIASALMGSEELMIAMLEEPEDVKKLLEEISDIWVEASKKIFEADANIQDGYATWMPLWSRDRWYPIQSDFSVMISPKMYEEFVAPFVAKEAASLDKAIYHLDGPGAVKHLDRILEIPNIQGVEWVPMPNSDGFLDTANECWFPMYEKIQKQNKCLVLRYTNPNDVEKLLSFLSPKGLYIQTVAQNEEDADLIIENAKKWSKH